MPANRVVTARTEYLLHTAAWMTQPRDFEIGFPYSHHLVFQREQVDAPNDKVSAQAVWRNARKADAARDHLEVFCLDQSDLTVAASARVTVTAQSGVGTRQHPVYGQQRFPSAGSHSDPFNGTSLR